MIAPDSEGLIAPSATRARNVVVISLHKAGTHLIEKVVRSLGYATTGAGSDNASPEWIGRGSPANSAATQALPAFLADMPPNTAYFQHSLPLSQLTPELVRAWTSSYEPPIIFHYRDPRDVVLSFIDYCLKPELHSKEFANGPMNLLAMDILRNCAPENRIYIAIQFLETYLWMYREALWLLYHPRILKTRFESLVGPRGGGSAALQLEEVRRIQQHLRTGCDAKAICAEAFDTTTRTFSKGKAHRWREEFGERERAAFAEKYALILKLYGYE